MIKQLAVVLQAVAFLSVSGCQKAQKTDSESIREGIELHLSSLKTLNLSAMDMKIADTSLSGNSAEVLVEFSPKNGAPSGATMKVSYSLEKRGDTWVVVRTNALGGGIDHPASQVNPHSRQVQGEVHGNLPNFRDLIAPAHSGQQSTPSASDPTTNLAQKP